MEVINLIPDEIWKMIFSEVNIRDIFRIYRVNLKFNSVCENFNLKQLIQFKGFPRISGHNKNIDCSKFEILFKDDFYYENDENRHKVLNRLLDENCSLVRGDILYFRSLGTVIDGVFIFDGINIVKLISGKNRKYLPKEFIINDIPIDYWYNTNDLINDNFNQVPLQESSAQFDDGLVWINTKMIKNIKTSRDTHDNFGEIIYINDVSFHINNIYGNWLCAYFYYDSEPNFDDLIKLYDKIPFHIDQVGWEYMLCTTKRELKILKFFK